MQKKSRGNTFLWLYTLLALGGVVVLTLFNPWLVGLRPIAVERGDLARLISETVDAMPSRGSEAYASPSPKEASEFAALASSMAVGDLERARLSTEILGYTLVWYEDTPTGQRVLVAREEEVPTHKARRGWGTIIVNPDGSGVVVEVPHPLFDIGTPELGVELFQQIEARALLVAGAHRYSWDDGQSDVAHAPGTAFDAAHRALLPAAHYVIQPHGFHSEEKEHPNVVLSAGSTPAPTWLEALYHGMQNAGIDVSFFDGDPYLDDVAGTTNLQGISTREAGSKFLHIELEKPTRTDPVERSKFVKALAQEIMQQDP